MISENWQKSSFSSAGQDCVELRRVGDGVQVRDSKNPESGILDYTMGEWQAFIAGVKHGEFDL